MNKNISKIFSDIKNKLIVSCQGEENSPFNDPESISRFAISAVMGGAGGVRLEGYNNISLVRKLIKEPIIGLIKSKFDDGFVRITRKFGEVERLYSLGCDIIAIDGTSRIVDGFSGHDFILQCKKNYPNICVMADISSIEEAENCVLNGADCISTTLRGYTPQTRFLSDKPMEVDFIKKLVKSINDVPIIAEGRIDSPDLAKKVSETGVWSIVIGTAITRPIALTERYVKSIYLNY